MPPMNYFMEIQRWELFDAKSENPWNLGLWRNELHFMIRGISQIANLMGERRDLGDELDFHSNSRIFLFFIYLRRGCL